MDGLIQQLEALATSRLPPGARLATDDEINGPPRELRRFIRQAAKQLVERGWHRTETRLVFDAPSGHWADIKFDIGPGPAPVWLVLYAVVGSPYLSIVHDRGDGRRPRSWGSGHALLLWQVEIDYDPDARGSPARLEIPAVYDTTGITLGRDDAAQWLAELFERLATSMEGLCSDRAMRDWLVERGGGAVRNLRFAVLLSRRLGDLDRQVDLIERTRLETEASDARLSAQDPLMRRNDRGRDPLFWSHQRFMRFVNQLEE